MSLIPGLGRYPGEGNGRLLQYSGLGNPMDRGAWWATVHQVTRVGHNLDLKHHHWDGALLSGGTLLFLVYSRDSIKKDLQVLPGNET